MYHYACITHPLEGRGMGSTKYIYLVKSSVLLVTRCLTTPAGDLTFPLSLPDKL